MKNPNVTILGATGAVGREMLKILEERNFSHWGTALPGQCPQCREKAAFCWARNHGRRGNGCCLY